MISRIIFILVIIVVVIFIKYLKFIRERDFIIISKFIQWEDIEIIKKGISEWFNINMTNERWTTFLMQACSMWRTEVAELLIDNWANIHAYTRWRFSNENDLGNNALMFAILGGFTECVEMLLKRWAYIDIHSDEWKHILKYTNDECKKLLKKYSWLKMRWNNINNYSDFL